MRVLLINNFDYIRGGSDRVFLDTAILLHQYGHEVAIFSARSSTPHELPVAIKRYYTPDLIEADNRSQITKAVAFIKNNQAIENLKRCLLDFAPDVAHLHIFQSRLSSFIVKTLNQYQIPTVMTVHEYKMLCPIYTHLDPDGNICAQCRPGDYRPCISKKCVEGSLIKSTLMATEAYVRYHRTAYMQYITKFAMPSRFILRQHRQQFPAYEDKMLHCPNFIDTKEVKTDYVQGEYLLYFGRLSYVKGMKTLLQATANAKHIPIKIAGTGPILSELQEFKRKHYLDHVEFVGFQKGKDLFKLISHSRATIIPSEWYENAPLSIIESLALGRPVIGANIGGIPEMVIDYKTGLRFESGNTEQLQAAIQQLWELSSEQHFQLSQSCRAFAVATYGRDQHYRQLLDIYQAITQKTVGLSISGSTNG